MTRRDRLPCGTPLDELLIQVADGAPPKNAAHQRTCPHCRAALAEVRALWAPVAQLAVERPHAPATVRSSVMAMIRSLPHTAWHAVLHDDRGSTRVAARVISTIVRRAADGIPSIALAFGRSRFGAAPGRAESFDATQVGVAGRSIVLDVSVVVRFGASIPTSTHQLRTRIRQHVAELVGLEPTEINIDVVDVHHEA